MKLKEKLAKDIAVNAVGTEARLMYLAYLSGFEKAREMAQKYLNEKFECRSGYEYGFDGQPRKTVEFVVTAGDCLRDLGEEEVECRYITSHKVFHEKDEKAVK